MALRLPGPEAVRGFRRDQSSEIEETCRDQITRWIKEPLVKPVSSAELGHRWQSPAETPTSSRS
jgi:hypothetical protein